MNLSRILTALATVALFAQTGVTQLDVSAHTMGFLVFGIGLVSVFLSSITSSFTGPGKALLKFARLRPKGS